MFIPPSLDPQSTTRRHAVCRASRLNSSVTTQGGCQAPGLPQSVGTANGSAGAGRRTGCRGGEPSEGRGFGVRRRAGRSGESADGSVRALSTGRVGVTAAVTTGRTVASRCAGTGLPLPASASRDRPRARSEAATVEATVLRGRITGSPCPPKPPRSRRHEQFRARITLLGKGEDQSFDRCRPDSGGSRASTPARSSATAGRRAVRPPLSARRPPTVPASPSWPAR